MQCNVGMCHILTPLVWPCLRSNQGYEIVTSACVKDDVLLDSLYVHIQAKTPGTKAVGVVYDTSPPTTNKSFCSADVDVSKPRRLVSNGTLTALESSNAVWLRLPMPPTRLTTGVYWIGVMLDADATCVCYQREPCRSHISVDTFG